MMKTPKCTHVDTHRESCPTRSDLWIQEGALGKRKSSLGQTSSTHPSMGTICMHSQIPEVDPPHTQEHGPVLISTCDTAPLTLFTIWCLSSAVRRQQSEWGEAEGGGTESRWGGASRARWRSVLSLVLGSVCHCGPAWGCFWQQPLQQIIEQQMKTNDMIAVRVPAVNPLSRWFPFKAIDQLYNLSSWPGN